MTVMELTNKLWYAQPVEVVRRGYLIDKASSEDDIIMHGPNYKLGSIRYKDINKMSVVSYGVNDGTFVIIVR